MVMQAPVLLQMVQLWAVLGSLGQRGRAREALPELSYLETGFSQVLQHRFLWIWFLKVLPLFEF